MLCVACFTIIFLQTLGISHCANILISSEYGAGSHFLSASNIGRTLVQRGHNVTMLIGAACAHRAVDPKFKDLNFVIFNHSDDVGEITNRIHSVGGLVFEPPFVQLLKYFRIFEQGYYNDCEKLLRDDVTIGLLKDGKFEVVLVDYVWFCGMLIAEKIGKVPVIGISAVSFSTITFSSAGTPINPAFMNELLLGFPQRMNFGQRLTNALVVALSKALIPLLLRKYDALFDEHGLCQKGKTLLHYLYNDVSLWLVNVDFTLEFPVPITPNLVPVGGLSTSPADALSEELEEFMASAGEHGVIIFTLGSYFTLGKYMATLKSDFVQIFSDAFAQLDQRVIWHMKDADELTTNLPENVKTMPWIPQNDLLGHKKTLLFMYHGGNNGLYEALYHGVPTIVIPLMGDQYDVGMRVESRGMGLRMDKMTLTTEKILNAIRTIINNDTYRETARRLSAIFHDHPMSPRDRAAFWIEHIIAHGASHLRSTYNDLSFIQSSLLDVWAFLLVIASVVLFVLYMMLRCAIKLFRNCLQRGKSKED